VRSLPEPAPLASTEPAPTHADAPVSGPSILRNLEAAAVLAAALLALLFHLRLPSALPSEADYRSLGAIIEEQAREGDAVLLDPHWAERARLFVSTVPVLNLARTPAIEDLDRFQRLFVLSLPALPRSSSADVRALLSSGGFREVRTQVQGNLSLSVFENGARATPLYDFTDRVVDARVYIRRPDGSEEACPLQGQRHPCPRAGWLNVGAEIKEIAFKPFRCLWAHPAGSEPLVVEYPHVKLGRSLRVTGGIVGQIAFRTERYATVTLAVKIDGESVAIIDFPPGQPGERRRTIDTSRFEGAEHDVRFEVSAPDPGMRHFCFDAGVY